MEDRREIYEGKGNPTTGFERAATAYWQRHADYAATWLREHATAPEKDYDRAFAYRVAALRNARTAGGIKSDWSAPNLRNEYEETENPLYAWQALCHIIYGGPLGNDTLGPTAVPAWLIQFLGNIAAHLTTLGEPGMPCATSENVANIFGITSQGYSAFKKRRDRRQDQSRAAFTQVLQAAGMTAERARKVAFPHIAHPRALRRAQKRGSPRK